MNNFPFINKSIKENFNTEAASQGMDTPNTETTPGGNFGNNTYPEVKFSFADAIANEKPEEINTDVNECVDNHDKFLKVYRKKWVITRKWEQKRTCWWNHCHVNWSYSDEWEQVLIKNNQSWKYWMWLNKYEQLRILDQFVNRCDESRSGGGGDIYDWNGYYKQKYYLDYNEIEEQSKKEAGYKKPDAEDCGVVERKTVYDLLEEDYADLNKSLLEKKYTEIKDLISNSLKKNSKYHKMFKGLANDNYFKTYLNNYPSNGEKYKRQNTILNNWNNVYDSGKDTKGYGWKWFSEYCPLLATLYWENTNNAIKYWIIRDKNNSDNIICDYSVLFFKLKYGGYLPMDKMSNELFRNWEGQHNGVVGQFWKGCYYFKFEHQNGKITSTSLNGNGNKYGFFELDNLPESPIENVFYGRSFCDIVQNLVQRSIPNRIGYDSEPVTIEPGEISSPNDFSEYAPNTGFIGGKTIVDGINSLDLKEECSDSDIKFFKNDFKYSFCNKTTDPQDGTVWKDESGWLDQSAGADKNYVLDTIKQNSEIAEFINSCNKSCFIQSAIKKEEKSNNDEHNPHKSGDSFMFYGKDEPSDNNYSNWNLGDLHSKINKYTIKNHNCHINKNHITNNNDYNTLIKNFCDERLAHCHYDNDDTNRVNPKLGIFNFTKHEKLDFSIKPHDLDELDGKDKEISTINIAESKNPEYCSFALMDKLYDYPEDQKWGYEPTEENDPTCYRLLQFAEKGSLSNYNTDTTGETFQNRMKEGFEDEKLTGDKILERYQVLINEETQHLNCYSIINTIYLKLKDHQSDLGDIEIDNGGRIKPTNRNWGNENNNLYNLSFKICKILYKKIIGDDYTISLIRGDNASKVRFFLGNNILNKLRLKYLAALPVEIDNYEDIKSNLDTSPTIDNFIIKVLNNKLKTFIETYIYVLEKGSLLSGENKYKNFDKMINKVINDESIGGINSYKNFINILNSKKHNHDSTTYKAIIQNKAIVNNTKYYRILLWSLAFIGLSYLIYKKVIKK